MNHAIGNKLNSNQRLDHSKTISDRNVLRLALLMLFVLCCLSLFSLLARMHWVADLLANLRIQQNLGLAAVFPVLVWYRQRLACAIAVVVFAVHLPWFLTALPETTKTAIVHESFSITCANVLTTNRQHEAVLADLIDRDPDVIVIVELSSSLSQKLRAELGTEYPDQIMRPQDRHNFGIGLISKYPVSDVEVFEAGANSGESIAVTITTKKQAYRVYAVHPVPPMGTQGFEYRNRQLQGIAAHVKRYLDDHAAFPIVLVGDLNLTPWSPLFASFQTSSGLLRAIDRFDLNPTWYRYPWFPFGLQLDHGLISQNVTCIGYQVGPFTGSDHRSITLRVTSQFD